MSTRIIEGAAIVLLIFSPLAFGAVQPWSEAIVELVVLLMLLVWILRMILQWELRVALPPGWVPAALFLGFVLLQATPLPARLVEVAAPLSASVYREAFAFTGEPLRAAPISLDAAMTLRQAQKLLAVAGFVLVLHNTVVTGEQARRLVRVMIGMGAALALLGIVQRATWNGRLYWIGPRAPHENAFGPFVNRAHFAALVIVVVPMALALILGARRASHGRRRLLGLGARLREWTLADQGASRLVAFLILLMGGATLVAGSRGGVVSLMAALVAMIGLAARGPAGARRAGRIAVVAVLVVLAGVWISGDVVSSTVQRLAEEVERPAEGWRLPLWRDALHLWRLSPVLGTGLATFETAFPRVRTIDDPATFTHAESDVVQLLTDTGVVGLALVATAVAEWILVLLRRLRAPVILPVRTLALGGLVALIATLVQGMANFNLPVMSNQLYLAAALVAALRADKPPGEAPPAAPHRSRRAGRETLA